MSNLSQLAIPQYDAVEIVFLPQEVLLGGKNTGLDAWFSCVPCGGRFNWISDKGYMVCDGCGNDVSRVELASLINGYRSELERLIVVTGVTSTVKGSLFSRIFKRSAK